MTRQQLIGVEHDRRDATLSNLRRSACASAVLPDAGRPVSQIAIHVTFP